MSGETELQMWSYWSCKHGVLVALKDYYPELVERDPILRPALAQVEVGMLAIVGRMATLVNEDDDKNGVGP